jgi:DNA polymerase I-like protein with 3'-5' exonuclease and polymerase domains
LFGSVCAIHDSLGAILQVAQTVKGIMEGAVKFSVPICVNMSYGARWGSLTPYTNDLVKAA